MAYLLTFLNDELIFDIVDNGYIVPRFSSDVSKGHDRSLLGERSERSRGGKLKRDHDSFSRLQSPFQSSHQSTHGTALAWSPVHVSTDHSLFLLTNDSAFIRSPLSSFLLLTAYVTTISCHSLLHLGTIVQFAAIPSRLMIVSETAEHVESWAKRRQSLCKLRQRPAHWAVREVQMCGSTSI